MFRTNWVPRGLLVAAMTLPMACTNNPFNPRAELVVTEVKATRSTTTVVRGFEDRIGIAQMYEKADSQVPTFFYADPQVTIKSGPQQPEVYIDTAVVTYTIGQTTLPAKRLPMIVTVPKGGQVSQTVPILRSDADLRNAVFPNNTPTMGTEGFAEVTLLGRDKNGNETSVAFTAPLTFVTMVGGATIVGVNPLPSASPTPTPDPGTPQPGDPGSAQPSPSPSPFVGG